MRDTIGFLGLGHLGLPLATNLLDEGYCLRVYNRTAAKAEPLVARGAQQVARPADVASPGGIVVSLLWDGGSVESVVRSEGFLERLGPDGIHVSMSTIAPDAARAIARLHAEHGSHFVEAPIFGRPEAAAARKLWIPFAGPAAAKTRIGPLLTALGAQGVFDFGEAIGAANVVKIAGNFLIASSARSLAEAYTMADHAGIDARAMVEMLTTTLFTAPIYQSYAKTLADKGVAFTAQGNKIVAKDLGLFRSNALAVGSPAPIATCLAGL